VIRETLAMEMRRGGRKAVPARGRMPYGGPQPDFNPNAVDDDDFAFLGAPPDMSPEEMEDMRRGEDDVPETAADLALRIGHDHRRKMGYRGY